MTSFVAFKRAVLDAFDGEGVDVEVLRSAHRWHIGVKHSGIAAVATTNATEMTDKTKIRLFAASVFVGLMKEVQNERLRTGRVRPDSLIQAPSAADYSAFRIAAPDSPLDRR